jgi:hypothetical protein
VESSPTHWLLQLRGRHLAGLFELAGDADGHWSLRASA